MKEIGMYKEFSFSNFTELVEFLIGDGKGKINKNRFVTYKGNCYVYVGEADKSDDELMELTDDAKWELRLELYPGAAQEVDGCDDDYPSLSLYYYTDGEPDDKAFAKDYDITDFVGHEKVNKKAEAEAIIKAFKNKKKYIVLRHLYEDDDFTVYLYDKKKDAEDCVKKLIDEQLGDSWSKEELDSLKEEALDSIKSVGFWSDEDTIFIDVFDTKIDD